MMMTDIAEHERRSHGDFLFSNVSGVRQSSREMNDDSEDKHAKRLRTSAVRGATISTREKKDKIGERIIRLQELVSPFGKSDTSSVLQEAAAYIKFLHEQLEVLSAPYLQVPVATKMEEGDHYYSLRRRGLCLAPTDSTIKIVQNNGADLWAPAKST